MVSKSCVVLNDVEVHSDTPRALPGALTRSLTGGFRAAGFEVVAVILMPVNFRSENVAAMHANRLGDHLKANGFLIDHFSVNRESHWRNGMDVKRTNLPKNNLFAF